MAEHMLILGWNRRRQSDVHGRGFSERMWKDEPRDDGVRAGRPGLPRLTVGDDISWMKIGEDGYLRAIIRKPDFLA